MHAALKDSLYKKAKDIISSGNVARVYQFPEVDKGTDCLDMNILKDIFKYFYDEGWPVIKVEEVNKVDYLYNT